MKTNVEGDASTKGDGWAALDEVERRTRGYRDLIAACADQIREGGGAYQDLDRRAFTLSMVLWFIKEVRKEWGRT